MKIISLNMNQYKEGNIEKTLASIKNENADIVILTRVNICNSNNLNLREHKYNYYDKSNAMFIMSKAMFAIVNNEGSNYKNCCEIYLPGLDTSLLALTTPENTDSKDFIKTFIGYRNCVRNNEILVIDDFNEEGLFNIYDFSEIEIHAS